MGPLAYDREIATPRRAAQSLWLALGIGCALGLACLLGAVPLTRLLGGSGRAAACF